ncbi:MAG: hypothetical protein ABJA89_05660 [Lapillicoccus sp.]
MSAPDDRFAALVHDALHGAAADDGSARPSTDLFDRVVVSIDADRRRRQHARVVVGLWVAAVAVVTTLVLTLTPHDPEGALTMSWWVLELATTAALIGIALWLGPFIKRFGRAYAADVFHDNPLTGKSYIVLTDVVYYLIFAAYILFTASLQQQSDWPSFTGMVTSEQVGAEVRRIGGILLVVGVLHGVNIVVMPVLGRLFSLNRRLPPPAPGQGPVTPSERGGRSIYERAAELERAADDNPR